MEQPVSDRQPLETGTDDLLGWVENGVAYLSFNRPASRNALSASMYEGFGRALPVVAQDPSIGCLVLTGEGGAFCAGGDVKGFAEGHKRETTEVRPSPAAAIDNLRRLQAQCTLAIHRLPKMTIAAVPGAAAGAGLSFALSCDMRVATEKALFVTAFANIGASGDFGGSYFLTQLVGPSKAKELYALSERLTAREAQALGIVNRVFADDDYAEGVKQFAERVAAGSPLAQRAIKENINRALVSDLAACLDAEAANMIATMSSEDHRTAVAAFVAKTTPSFVGR
jgi:2-(1,2-epoxy-1,2-dihydrophenyl)acetyl-CoA isomerase